MYDQAIEYNAKLQKVKRTLDNMQKIGLNITKYNQLLEEINLELETSKESNFKDIFNNSMATDILNMAYIKALNKLEIIQMELGKYDVYLKTASFCKTLKIFLNNHNPDKDILTKNSAIILELLADIKKSETLDYAIEGHLVEEIYHLTYEFIKKEIQLTGFSLVLKEVTNNEIDKSYLEKEILKELDSLNLEEPKYRELANKKYEIESLGMNASYVNQEFISLIVNCTISYEYKKEILDTSIMNFNTYYDERVKLANLISSQNNRIKDIKQALLLSYKDLKANTFRTLLSLGTILILGVGAFKLSKLAATETKYKTITKTYSLDNSPITEEEYLPNSERGTFLCKYEPYNKNVSIYFRRKVTKYNLTNIDKLSLAEYLALDLEKLGIKGIVKEEIKEELVPSDLYAEVYYLLKEIEVDKLDSYQETNYILFIFYLFFTSIIGLIIDYGVEECFKEIFSDSTEPWLFIASIKEISYILKEIISRNKYKNLEQQELKELLKKAQNLLIDNEELVLNICKYLKTCDNEDQKVLIKDKLERIRELKF